jgi:hypothetical protein
MVSRFFEINSRFPITATGGFILMAAATDKSATSPALPNVFTQWNQVFHQPRWPESRRLLSKFSQNDTGGILTLA